MGSITMHALANNIFQLGLLGLGVSLLLVWINSVKAERDRVAAEEPEDRSAETTTASATRSRTGP